MVGVRHRIWFENQIQGKHTHGIFQTVDPVAICFSEHSGLHHFDDLSGMDIGDKMTAFNQFAVG